MAQVAHPYPTDRVAELIKRDEGAWTQVIDELQAKLLLYARKRGLSQHDAEDAVQEMWPRAIAKIYLRPPTVLYPAFFYWQLRDSVSRIRRRLKKHRSVSLELRLADDGELIDLLADEYEFFGVSTVLEEEELLGAARCALEGLDPYDQKVVKLLTAKAKLKGKAKELDVTAKTVKVHETKALGRLRQAFRRELGITEI